MARAAAVALALVAALPALGAAPQPAALKLESIAPLEISGRNFGPREAVLIRYELAVGRRGATGVRATRRGGFRAGFALRLGRCDSFVIRATGTNGSRAVLQVERRCEQPKGPPKRAPREQPG